MQARPRPDHPGSSTPEGIMIDPVDLKTLAGDRYRIVLDPSAGDDPSHAGRPWFYRVACKYGFIGVHGGSTLAVHCDRRRLFAALLAIPGGRVWQRGDREITVLVDAEHLDAAAGILKARRRRRLTEEQRERLVAAGQRNWFSRGTASD
jgi:hypothetical protein